MGHQCAAASVAKMGTSGGTTTIGTLRSQDSHIVVKQKLWLWPHKAVWQFSNRSMDIVHSLAMSYLDASLTKMPPVFSKRQVLEYFLKTLIITIQT